MKAAILPLVCILGSSGSALFAAPVIQSAQFKCEYKVATNEPFKVQGEVFPEVRDDGLHLKFYSSGDGAGMDYIRTTDSEFEDRVEGKCPGQITLSNNKPFRIKNFIFSSNDAQIQTQGGFIELYLKGWATMTNDPNKKDSFEKKWTANKSQIDKFNNAPDGPSKTQLYPFPAQTESTTICSNKLTLRFDNLHGVAVRDINENSEDFTTAISLDELLISFEPC